VNESVIVSVNALLDVVEVNVKKMVSVNFVSLIVNANGALHA